MTAPRVEAFGDSGVLVTLGDRIELAASARAAALAEAIAAATAGKPGWGRPINAYASVLISIDPLEPGVEAALDVVRTVVATASGSASAAGGQRPVLELPTRYGGPDGPDLETVAELHGLRPADVIELHAGMLYTVHFLGFAPGFAYLGELPSEIATPRLATPRTHVPAGSVAIADRQTAVYPFASPGGWRLLGRTTVDLWDVTADPPARLRARDRVRFVPIR